MERSDQPTSKSKDRVPAWLRAFFWSMLGIVGAILTICILSSSLLWLVRWASPGRPTSGPLQTGTAAAITLPQTSISSTISSSAQTATADTVQPSNTTTPPAPSPPAAQTLSPTVPGSSLTTPDNRLDVDTPEVAITLPSVPSSTSTKALSASPVATSTPTPTPTLTPTPTATPVPLSPQEYVVQRDDWLSKLSDKFYGDLFAYPAIVAATNAKAAEDDSFTFIEDPDVIEIGQKLWIPTAEEAAVLLAEEETEQPTSP